MSFSCNKCMVVKFPTEFHKNRKNLHGYAYTCKACRKEESLHKYGLSLESYDEILAEQEGLCKICKTDDPRGTSTAGRFYVDHNHETGKVRGLLCSNCNTGLGLLRDSPRIVSAALAYLQEEGNYDRS